jgi:hypothetical protein
MRIRSAVRENVLADPAKVPASAYYDLLSRARISLWDEDGVRGSAPQIRRTGLFGRSSLIHVTRGLVSSVSYWPWGHETSGRLAWVEARLSTEVGSRAERFYAREGWQMHGVTQSGERVFIKCLGGV